MFTFSPDQTTGKFSIFSSYLSVYFFILLIIVSYTFFYSLMLVRYVNDLKQNAKLDFSEKVFVGSVIALIGLPPMVVFVIKYCIMVVIFKEAIVFLSYLALVLLLLVWYLYIAMLRRYFSAGCHVYKNMDRISTNLALLVVIFTVFLFFGIILVLDLFFSFKILF